MRDGSGLELTGDSTAQEAWQAAVDALCAVPRDLEEAYRTAVAAAPGSAALLALHAFVGRMFGFASRPADDAARARELAASQPLSARERSLVRGLTTMVLAGPLAAHEALGAHLEAYPGDLAGFFPASIAMELCAVPGVAERLPGAADALVAAHPGDWRSLGLAAYLWGEAGRHDEAASAARQALSACPDAAHAAHALAHTFHSAGRHREGLAVTGDWLAAHPVPFYGVHLSWHLAVHEVALGRGDDALGRLGRSIPLGALAEAGPLLWRCRMAGVPAASGHAAAAAVAASTLAVIRSLPVAFDGYNAALALAAAGDAEGLEALADKASSDQRPGFPDLLAPVARGLARVLLGEYSAAVALLRPVLPYLPGLGGSEAQREVVAQTLAFAEAAG